LAASDLTHVDETGINIGGKRHWLYCVSNDLAGGKLPSDDFGENAAWWPACAMHADR